MGAVIVAICIGVPAVEAFDRWDQTLADGNDTEANVVVAALCVGLALSAVHTSVNLLLRALRSCLLYTSPSPRDGLLSRMPSSA